MISTTRGFRLLIVVLAIALASFGCQQSTGSSVDATPPNPVQQLSANTGDGQLELRWNEPANNDFDHVAITWSPEDGEDQPKTVSAGTETATLFGLNNGTEYLVTVKSMDTAGNSSSGASVHAPAADVSSLFSDASAGLTGVLISSSSLGDVDGDSDLDLVVTGDDAGAETATLYEYSLGGYSSAPTPLTGVAFGSSSFGDVDGDGDLDLVITGSDGSTETATLYTNDGTGSFTDASAGLTAVDDSSSSFGVVDGDGDLDLVLTGHDNSNTPTATLYTNDGRGSFTAASAGLTGVNFGSINFGDVDGDGDLDLVLTGQSTSGRTATLYENQLF